MDSSVKDVSEKLFDRDSNIETVEVGISDFYLYPKNEIIEAQAGFRYNAETKELIKDWIGDNYMVIGYDSAGGDPFITDVSSTELPVFTMIHDDWSSLEKITDSFENYISILKMIKETDLSDKDKKDKLLSDINKLNENKYKDFWDSKINDAYEFYKDI